MDKPKIKIKEKKKKCGLPTGLKKRHPLDRKQTVFLGCPYFPYFHANFNYYTHNMKTI